MTISDLHKLIEEVEEEKHWLFLVYDTGSKVAIDVLDWEDEEAVDGSWFDTVDEAIEFVKEFKGSL